MWSRLIVVKHVSFKPGFKVTLWWEVIMYTRLCSYDCKKRGILQTSSSKTNLSKVYFLYHFPVSSASQGMCLNWRQMQAYILFPLHCSLMNVLEDLRFIPHLYKCFLPQNVRIEHGHFWPEYASQWSWGTWVWGTLHTLLSLQQGPSSKWPRETGHPSKGLTQPWKDPQNGRQEQRLCHILQLPISDNSHNWKQQPRGVTCPQPCFATIFQTPASQEKGSLVPCSCSFRH